MDAAGDLPAALASAAGAVRADLERTGAWCPAAAAAVEQAIEHRSWWLEQWPEGADHIPGLVAQDVQEAVQEHVDPAWPRCGEHGDHPLFIEPDLGPDPFWVCGRSGLPVASVGGL